MLFNANCLDIMKTLADRSIDLVLTDPPYEIEDMTEYFNEMVRVLKDSGSIYIFGDKKLVAEYWYSQLKIKHKDFLVWHYKNSPKPRGRWRMSMQAVVYGFKDKNSVFHQDEARVPYLESTKALDKRMRPSKGRMTEAAPYVIHPDGALPRDVVECPALLGHLSKERLGHRDQKPIALIEKLMRTSSNENDLVLDPFMGSGTTIEAAIKNNRNYIGIELNQEYYKVCCKREDIAVKEKVL